jgi:hypothetical protein
MKKELLSEEISQMRYLFGYKKGVVISEQDVPTTGDQIQQQKDENQDLQNELSNLSREIFALRLDNFEAMAQGGIDKISGYIDEIENKINNFGNRVFTAVETKIKNTKDAAQRKRLEYLMSQKQRMEERKQELMRRKEELAKTGKLMTNEEKEKIKGILLSDIATVIFASLYLVKTIGLPGNIIQSIFNKFVDKNSDNAYFQSRVSELQSNM